MQRTVGMYIANRIKDEILKRAGDGAKPKPGARIEDTIKDRLKGILGR